MKILFISSIYLIAILLILGFQYVLALMGHPVSLWFLKLIGVM